MVSGGRLRRSNGRMEPRTTRQMKNRAEKGYGERTTQKIKGECGSQEKKYKIIPLDS